MICFGTAALLLFKSVRALLLGSVRKLIPRRADSDAAIEMRISDELLAKAYPYGALSCLSPAPCYFSRSKYEC